MLLALILAGFPVEVPAGGTTEVWGTTPRVVFDGRDFIVVWVDDRRSWVDSRTPTSLFTATVRVDGGLQVLRTEELALGAVSPDELSVSAGPSGQLLAAWIEEPVSNEQWRLSWAIRQNSAVSRGTSGGFTDEVSSVTSAWSGSNATIAAVQPFSLLVFPFNGVVAPPSSGSPPAPPGIVSISAASTDGGGVTFALTNGNLWRLGHLSTPALAFTAVDGGSGPVRFSRVVLDPTSAGLLLRSDTHLTIVHSAGSLDAGPASAALGPLSLASMSGRSRFVIGLSTGLASAAVRFVELDGGVRTATLIDTSEVFVAASPTTSLAAVSRAASSQLELYEGSGPFAPPTALGVRPAMSRSLSLAPVGNRWVLSWQEGRDDVGQVQLQPVEADSGIGAPQSRASCVRPRIHAVRDGGVFLVCTPVNFVGPFGATAERLRNDLGVQSASLTGLPTAILGSVAFGDGLFAWALPGNWVARSLSSSLAVPSVPPGFTLTEGGGVTDSEIWVLGQSSAGLVRLLFVRPAPLTAQTSVEQSSGSINVNERPEYATAAPRRRSDGTWAALVGVAENESEPVRWSILARDGGATPLPPIDAGTRFVAVARPQSWVRVLSRFVPGSQGPGVGTGRVWAQQVFDDGGVSADIPVWDGGAVVGAPVAAVNEAGEVGVAWPLLVQGMPALQFTVLFGRDGGPMPVDAGAIANDAGLTVDGGVEPVPDAGLPDAGAPTPDAGAVDGGPVEPPLDGGPRDAGLLGDAGTLDAGGEETTADAGGRRDGGTTVNDGGDSGPPGRSVVVFAPVSCGCATPGPSASLLMFVAWVLVRATRRTSRARAAGDARGQ
ncbi:MAG: hypothetical protein SFW67_13200 [Myxococcaceae bacterium]|nr:hypothetical protein [Myxococcaceae bacterium]